MHRYLKAIGFDISGQEMTSRVSLWMYRMDSIIRQSYHIVPERISVRSGKITDSAWEYRCAEEMDENDVFEPSYYFPYFQGSGISTYSEVAVERKIEKEQYVGMCEDSRIGISLISHCRTE